MAAENLKKLVKRSFKKTKNELKAPATHKSEPPSSARSVAAKVEPREEEAEAYQVRHTRSLSQR
jgi:hypothetical protein